MNELINVKNNGDIHFITLNRPEKRNALSLDMVDSLINTIDILIENNARIVVFKGRGKNFSAGFDLEQIKDQTEELIIYRLIKIEILLQKIYSMRALTIAWAHGHNFGAGVDLIGACKLRYCSKESSFKMPGAQFGLILGSRRFSHIVGTSNAIQILSLSEKFNAITAKNINFINNIIEADQINKFIISLSKYSKNIDEITRASLFKALDITKYDMDLSLAELVRSIMRPGIKERLIDFIS